MEANVFTIIAIGIASLIGIWIIFYFIPVGLWFTAILSGVNISLIQLVFMRFRKVPPQIIVSAMIKGVKGGIPISQDDLEAHYLAGGNIDNVVDGLIYAKARNIELSFKQASQLDLGRMDIIEELQKRKI